MLTLTLVLVLSTAAASDSVTLAWDANPEPDIAGYLVEYGTASMQYTQSVRLGTVTQTTIVDLALDSTYYFVVRAFNAANELSPPSNEVSYATAGTPPPNPPQTGCVSVAGSSVEVRITNFDSTFVRGSDRGFHVDFNIGGDAEVTDIVLDLEDDGEPAQELTIKPGVGQGGRYIYGFAWKPTVNGTWPVTVKAKNTRGEWGSVTCRPGVVVSSQSSPPPSSWTFTASPTAITAGQTSTLSFTTSTSDVHNITISGQRPTYTCDAAACSGSLSVTPSETTTYVLSTVNAAGVAYPALSVTVTVAVVER